jgi:2-(1,2-epoxy-1,2-dihydrophenyl)acetyl-CoA isomerase
MLEKLEAIRTDSAIRAVVLQANGRSFSTGGDALGFVEHAADIEAYARQIAGLLNQVVMAMVDLPMPIVTAVHGIVTGGSVGFILGSDIVLVAPEASFTPYYSVVGPSPDGGWATWLPLLIGPRRAAEVLYLNQTIDAETAVAWGLANRIVPAERIRGTALTMAEEIAGKKPGSIRHTRQLLYRHRFDIAAGLEAELDHFVEQMVEGEGLAGFQEFVNRMQARKEKAAI